MTRKITALLITLSLLLMLPVPRASAEDWIKTDIGSVKDVGLMDVAIGDGDNDNVDAVYASADDGAVYQFLQDAKDPSKWRRSRVGASPDSGFVMWCVDVGDGDDDGRNEVYGGGYLPSVWTGDVYEFKLVNSRWVRTKMGIGGWVVFDVEVGDGDNDDRNEVYAASYDGHLYEFTKTNSWNAQDMGYSTYYLRGVAVGDGDNDGKDEVFAAGGYGRFAGAYMYTRSGTSWDIESLGSPPGQGWNVLTDVDVGDGDNDGKKELYITGYGVAYQVKLTSGSWQWTQIFSSPYTYLNRVDVGDGDNDGKNEVFIASAKGQMYRLEYSSGSWTSDSVGSAGNSMSGVAVGNGDRFPDQLEIYGSSTDGHVYRYMLDNVAPHNPVVWSTTHKVGVWSNISTVTVKWKQDPDPSGIDGFSYEWSTSATAIPDDTKDAEENVDTATSPPLSDGTHYFHIRTRDNALNWNSSATHFGPIYIDTTPPTSLGLSINNGTMYTNSRYVTLQISGNDSTSGMGWMMLSNNGLNWTDWLEWNTTYCSWDLINSTFGGTDSDGMKHVYLQGADKAYNLFQGTANASIFLDRQPPVNLQITINGGQEATSDPVVYLNISAADPGVASGLYRMRFSNDGRSWSPWEAWSTVKNQWSLISGYGGTDTDGNKTVYLQVMDRAGNTAGPVSDTIVLDRESPTASLSINSGAAYTNDSSVVLSVAWNDRGLRRQVHKLRTAVDRLGDPLCHQGVEPDLRLRGGGQ